MRAAVVAGVVVVSVVSAGIAHADPDPIARYEQLRAHGTPAQQHDARTVLAPLYAAKLDYATAAARLEEDARRSPATASDALTNALAYRAATGDDRRAAADGEAAFRAARAAGDRDGAAVIARSLVAVYGRLGKDAPAILERALALTSDTELDQRAFLAGKRAAQLWAASCPVPLWEGLCVRVHRTAPELLPNFVADAGASLRLEAVPRKKKLADAALRELGAVETALDFERLASEGVTRDVSFAVATAMLYQTDLQLEDDLAHPAPPAERIHQTVVLRHWYEFPLHAKNPQLEIAAAFRLALVPHVFGDETGDASLHAAARATYDQCLTTAGEGAVPGPWTAACVRERAQLDVLATPPILEALPPYVYELPEPVAEPAPPPRADPPAAVAEARAAFDAADRTGWNDAACASVPQRLAAIANTQPDLDYLELAGLAAEACHAWEPALRFYDRAAEHGSVAAQLDRATVQWILGDRATALATWRSVAVGAPDRFGAQLGLALAGLADVLAGAPATPELRAQIALAHSLARTRDAQAAAAGVAGIFAMSATPPQRGAAAYELERDFDDAHALRTRPWLWIALGAFERDTGRFETVAADVPDDLVGQYDRALSLLAAGDGKDAAPLLARATGVGTAYDRAVATGVAARQTGNIAGAKTAYEAALALDAARPEAHEDLAILLAFAIAPRASSAAEAAAALDAAAAHFRAARDPAHADQCAAERAKLAP